MQVEGQQVPRGRRVSITFRRVLPSHACFCTFPTACDTTEEERQEVLMVYRREQVRKEGRTVGWLWKGRGRRDKAMGMVCVLCLLQTNL